MNNEEIIRTIEAIQWDYEVALVPESIHYIQKDDLVMIKNEKSTSVYANKVVRFNRSIDEIEDVVSFFEGSPFSWWVRADANSIELETKLINRGMKHYETYIGLANEIKDISLPTSEFIYKEVTTEEEVRAHVKVAGEIWGYQEKTLQAAFQERMYYLQSVNRRGGYTIALDGNKPVGYSNYRLSNDRKALYLNGAGVLPDYRGKGLYRNMLTRRLHAAKEQGCEIAVTQGRLGTSEPILRKLGFKQYVTYKQYIRV